MKVAVIGAGNWGKNLVRTLHALGALGAVAEASPALRDAVSRDYPGVAVHAEHRAVWSGDEAAVIGHVKARLANFKAPKRVRFLAELPRNQMGKVEKAVLRRLLAGEG